MYNPYVRVTTSKIIFIWWSCSYYTNQVQRLVLGYISLVPRVLGQAKSLGTRLYTCILEMYNHQCDFVCATTKYEYLFCGCDPYIWLHALYRGWILFLPRFIMLLLPDITHVTLLTSICLHDHIKYHLPLICFNFLM